MISNFIRGKQSHCTSETDFKTKGPGAEVKKNFANISERKKEKKCVCTFGNCSVCHGSIDNGNIVKQ